MRQIGRGDGPGLRDWTTRAGIAALCLCAAMARPTRAEAPRDTYEIHASLDAQTHTITGRAQIRWSNRSEISVDELWWHLYLNAFADEDSVFLRESGRRLRGKPYRGPGSVTVTKLETEDGIDLLAHATRDVGVEGDDTQMKVSLPAPVPAGASIGLRIEFTSVLPRAFARTGYVDDYHAVTQWFPKLARLERDGQWASFPYHALGEFYADFADYRVHIETPKRMVVAATGIESTSEDRGDRVTRTYVANRVHDFAFVAAPDLRVREYPLGMIQLRIFYPPGYGRAVHENLRGIQAGLPRLQALFGPYPYPALTAVVPPYDAHATAGMEYPTLYMGSGPWYVRPSWDVSEQLDTATHELAHQWFQGIIATDEVRWPMLDEGLATWAGLDIVRTLSAPRGPEVSISSFQADPFEMLQRYGFRNRETPPPGRPVDEFDARTYGAAVYGRPALLLETIARAWGRERLEAALSRYAEQQRFQHPEPEDLFAAFDQIFGEAFSREVLEPALMDGVHAEVKMTALDCEPVGEEWVTTVVAERIEALPIPLSIALYPEHGDPIRVSWPGDQSTLRHEYRGVRIQSAHIDPDGVNLMEFRRADNGRNLEPATPGWLAAAIWLTQTLLGVVGP